MSACASVVLATIVCSAGLAGAEVNRYAGSNRYATSVAIASSQPGGFDGGSSGHVSILVASGESYPDALAAEYLAGEFSNAVLVLTQGSQLSPDTQNYFQALGNITPFVDRVLVIDGAAQISDATVSQIGQAINTNRGNPGHYGAAPAPVRLHGTDEYSMAATVAQYPGTAVGSTLAYGLTAVVASGANYPDALAGSPVIWNQHFPLLLTDPNQLSAPSQSALSSLKIKTVLLLGGPAAVSTSVEQQIKAMGIQVVRVAGSTRQGTAVALAQLEVSQLGFNNNQVFLARGDDYPDALVGGQYAGYKEAPIVLTATPSDLSDTTRTYLQSVGGQVQGNVSVFGGPAAVSDVTWNDARQAAS